MGLALLVICHFHSSQGGSNPTVDLTPPGRLSHALVALGLLALDGPLPPLSLSNLAPPGREAVCCSAYLTGTNKVTSYHVTQPNCKCLVCPVCSCSMRFLHLAMKVNCHLNLVLLATIICFSPLLSNMVHD